VVYPVKLLGAKMKVVALNETVSTPAGTFVGCYRLDLVTGTGYRSFSFAPGVGLVRFVKGSLTWKLHRAKIKGSDGEWYTLGYE